MDAQAKPGLVFAEQPPVPPWIQELLNAKTRNASGRRVHDLGLSACILRFSSESFKERTAIRKIPDRINHRGTRSGVIQTLVGTGAYRDRSAGPAGQRRARHSDRK